MMIQYKYTYKYDILIVDQIKLEIQIQRNKSSSIYPFCHKEACNFKVQHKYKDKHFFISWSYDYR